MKILWITNIIFPYTSEQLGVSKPFMGGWMLASAKALVENGEVELFVATVYSGKEMKIVKSDSISYYLLPLKGSKIHYSKSLELYWQQVKREVEPEVVHIHGTEYAHGLSYLRACGSDGVVISIQGLVSVCERYYLAGMSFMEVVKSYTLRDLLKGGLYRQQRDFKRRGVLEQEYLEKANHIIGRTSWDKAHVKAINSKVNYHFCNETLRETFYHHQWNYETCVPYTIFLSQAGYPIKGLHQLLKAMPFILKQYPGARVIVAGPDITDATTIKTRLKRGGYGKYIKQLIHKYHLEDKITFTGMLTEEQMCEQYLKANVFVCPSAIENSPNSLGEAQLLGVPCVAAYVGGVMDMIPDESCGLMNRFEEVEMLAENICKLFSNTDYNNSKQRQKAVERHNQIMNRDRLMEIYKTIPSNIL